MQKDIKRFKMMKEMDLGPQKVTQNDWRNTE